MSELKARRAYFSEDEYDVGAHKICAKVSDCGYDRRNDWWSYAFEDEVYLKSEADKVIAEKDKEIAELKKRLENTISAASITCGAVSRCNEELRHSNYKRCLDKAKWCKLWYEKEKYEWQLNDVHHWFRMSLFDKWRKRWLELAEKFKYNKE